ncbi:hypothetical protein BJ508DRAFT_362186 [Ascobolus immersus RN42]|uniref:Mid2 domain-containing protein n=1 Tax=Ascobolus immersus RN42 TaxID=1160509 RepID=A0A3N4I8H9_ASCIM|nr:hypothetical protein BJ508DRAFT_362186 [Ascobolus immersus RN42]
MEPRATSITTRIDHAGFRTPANNEIITAGEEYKLEVGKYSDTPYKIREIRLWEWVPENELEMDYWSTPSSEMKNIYDPWIAKFNERGSDIINEKSIVWTPWEKHNTNKRYQLGVLWYFLDKDGEPDYAMDGRPMPHLSFGMKIKMPLVEPAPESPTKPMPEPTSKPTPKPSPEPSPEPISKPSPEPTSKPAPEPTSKPSAEPTWKPPVEPTSKPSPESPDKSPSKPSLQPSADPSAEPTAEPNNGGEVRAQPTSDSKLPIPNDGTDDLSSTTASTLTSPVPPTPQASTVNSNSTSLSTPAAPQAQSVPVGTIIGGALGGAALLIILLALVLWHRRQSRRNITEKFETSQELDATGMAEAAQLKVVPVEIDGNDILELNGNGSSVIEAPVKRELS